VPRRAPAHGAGSPAPGDYVPGLAAAANQMGTHAGRMILRSLAGQPRAPFHYRDKGALAIIGRNRAVADFGRVRIGGVLAFLTWVFVHILYLVGFRNRVSALMEWGYAYVTNRPGARLITPQDRRYHEPPR
jgi:NADH dehydrogenase